MRLIALHKVLEITSTGCSPAQKNSSKRLQKAAPVLRFCTTAFTVFSISFKAFNSDSNEASHSFFKLRRTVTSTFSFCGVCETNNHLQMRTWWSLKGPEDGATSYLLDCDCRKETSKCKRWRSGAVQLIPPCRNCAIEKRIRHFAALKAVLIKNYNYFKSLLEKSHRELRWLMRCFAADKNQS